MADDSRSRLGRGLAALLGDAAGDVVAEPRVAGGAPAPARPPRRVPIEHIKANPRNPRRNFADAELDELAASVKERGIIQPVVVRASAGAKDRYELIAGERRWRAAQRAGMHDIPIVLMEASDSEALELAIVENVQRTDLNPLEEASGYQRLASDYGRSHDAIAQMVGKSRSHVSNTVRLLKLPDSVKAYISAGEISAGAARMLIGAADPERMAREIVERGLNVRQVEALAKEHARSSAKSGRRKPGKSADTLALEQRLSDALGLTVTLVEHGTGGVLQIHYRAPDQLDDVLRRLEQS